uniref:Alpha-macroglobulin receptor-binding domain-containing protein n=1 Tax=Clastoptera arizonana TaxID=38151 RepID=A0A1B6EG34_9HEMI
MWLTALVVKTMEEAKDFTFIDDTVLRDSIQWMIKTQLENGCFPSIGQVFHTMQNNLTDAGTVALTSLVMLSLSAGQKHIPSSVVKNAKFCLSAGIASKDPYTMSLLTLALARLNFTDTAQVALERLLDLAEYNDHLLFWKIPGESVTISIETTSYAVLSLLELGGDKNLMLARKAVKWLLINRSSKGGFVSSLDTVTALEAISKFSTSSQSSHNTDLTVLLYGQQIEKSFKIQNKNKLVMQNYVLPIFPSQVEVFVQGEGCVIAQNVMNYNIDSAKGSDVFEIKVSTNSVSTVDLCSLQMLHICFHNKLINLSSNMVVLEVMFISGYKPYKNSLDEISASNADDNLSVVKKWEEEEEQIIFYLNKVVSRVQCIDFVMERRYAIEDPLPASITLTDYYHPERTISTMYSLQCKTFSDTMLSGLEELSFMNDDPFSNFHNVDHELETPEGIEGPQPSYALPPKQTNTSNI